MEQQQQHHPHRELISVKITDLDISQGHGLEDGGARKYGIICCCLATRWGYMCEVFA